MGGTTSGAVMLTAAFYVHGSHPCGAHYPKGIAKIYKNCELEKYSAKNLRKHERKRLRKIYVDDYRRFHGPP